MQYDPASRLLQVGERFFDHNGSMAKAIPVVSSTQKLNPDPYSDLGLDSDALITGEVNSGGTFVMDLIGLKVYQYNVQGNLVYEWEAPFLQTLYPWRYLVDRSVLFLAGQ
jgi:hypothetical protein